MCTAVVGGSIHRAATRISAASDQRSTTPMTSQRINHRRKLLRSGVLVCGSAIAVTFQNNSLGCRLWMISCARTESAAFLLRSLGTKLLVSESAWTPPQRQSVDQSRDVGHE